MSMVPEFLTAQVMADGDRIALDPVTDGPLTYVQFASRVEQLAARWGETLRAGRPVALRMDHGVHEAVAEIAALAAGLPVLSLPRFFTDEQVEHALAESGAQIVFDTDPASGEIPRGPAPRLRPLGTARVTFTSGSTAAPKGVCLSADHLLTVAKAVIEAVGSSNAGRHLALLPPGILLETVAGFLPTLITGGTYVCPPQAMVGMAEPFRPDFAQMLRAIADFRITSLILVPEYLAGLVAAMTASGTRLPLLKVVAVGGARVPADLIAKARSLGLPVRQGYGLTECGSVVSLERNDDGEPGSAGLPLSHLKLSIAPDGEVLIDGPLCLGTIGSDRLPGPLHTGDIGRIDERGRLWIEGRKSSLIVTSHGRNIAPEWLEAELAASPDIAQVMVYGDGLPAPEALIVPARPDSDLGAAVAAVNVRLPAYARIARWQEAAHFTPGNGRLTGNGRLRRRAIAAIYLGGEPAFFDRLEAQTVRQRIAFLSVPQLQAGLSGQIGRQAYLDYLAQAYHHVRHTVPLMRAARVRLQDRPEIIAALDEYIAEEEGHEAWILSDIAAAGGDSERVRLGEPPAAARAMVRHAYDRIENGNPVSFFGMVYVLESVSVAFAQRGARAVADNLGLPPEAFTYLTSHGALDQEHMAFFAALVNGLRRENDRTAIIAMAQEMFQLFGAIFASIDLSESVDVAA